MARRPDTSGEVVTLKEVLEPTSPGTRRRPGRRGAGRRAHRPRPQASRCVPATACCSTPASNLALERLPRPEVEELILEEVPDISYDDIGGLDVQIEQITDAVELPFVHAELFQRYDLPAPKGILLYGPARVRQDADREGGRQHARQAGRRGLRRPGGPQLLPQRQGSRAAQQVRRRDGAPDPADLPAGEGEVRAGLAGHRLLRRDGVAVPHARAAASARTWSPPSSRSCSPRSTASRASAT